MVEDEWDDDGYDEDMEMDDEEPTIPCPYCKHEIHEDSVRCPYSEKYISNEDAPPTRKPWSIYVGAAMLFYIVYRWIVGW